MDVVTHPDDFDPLTSRIKLLAQATWMYHFIVHSFACLHTMMVYTSICHDVSDASLHWKTYSL